MYTPCYAKDMPDQTGKEDSEFSINKNFRSVELVVCPIITSGATSDVKDLNRQCMWVSTLRDCSDLSAGSACEMLLITCGQRGVILCKVALIIETSQRNKQHVRNTNPH